MERKTRKDLAALSDFETENASGSWLPAQKLGSGAKCSKRLAQAARSTPLDQHHCHHELVVCNLFIAVLSAMASNDEKPATELNGELVADYTEGASPSSSSQPAKADRIYVDNSNLAELKTTCDEAVERVSKRSCPREIQLLYGRV